MIQINPILHAASTPFREVQYPNNPFHIGEITLQQLEHKQEYVMSYAPQFIRSHYMPDQHRSFYNDLPFLVVAVREPTTGYMWSSLLENTHPNENDEDDTDDGTVATSPDPNTLLIHARPVVGDALEHVFDDDTTTTSTTTTTISSSTTTKIDVGILGIQFETARRNRVNGRITIHSDTVNRTSTTPSHRRPLVFKVDQSFGNCPQYIKPRKQWYRAAAVPTRDTTMTTTDSIATSATVSTKKRSHRLSPRQIAWIETAETFFTATGYRDLNDENHETNVRYGNDASHRGGPPGFVQVMVTSNGQEQEEQQQEIVWTEFSGNNHFNSLGNLIVDSRIGLCFPNFTNGGMLQITGTATVQMGNLQQGQRQVRMSILAVNEVAPGSLPIRWPSDSKKTDSDTKNNNDANDKEVDDDNWTSLQVTKIVQESSNVKSFYIQRPKAPSKDEPKFHAGQHLPIQLQNGEEVLDRRYSISSSPFATDYYRISVKRHAHGKGSSYLHDQVKVGDRIKVGSPGGDFTLENSASQQPKSTIVLISAGIGITPLLSMLHELTSTEPQENFPNVYWIHGAKNSKEHPFQNEMKALQESFAASHSKDKLQIHTLYSAPETDDSSDKVGRITVQYVQDVVPNLTVHDVTVAVYMCGPLSFLADLETGLTNIGVAGTNIHYETF